MSFGVSAPIDLFPDRLLLPVIGFFWILTQVSSLFVAAVSLALAGRSPYNIDTILAIAARNAGSAPRSSSARTIRRRQLGYSLIEPGRLA